MLKSLARACLRVVTLTIPVFIAACYGVMARYNPSGKVIDKDTHEGLSDIKVNCMDSKGAVMTSAMSYSGDWAISSDLACDHLDAFDTQAPARYLEVANIPSANTSGITISMEKVK